MVRTLAVSSLLTILSCTGLLTGCTGIGSTVSPATLSGSSWTVERIVYPAGNVVRGDGETLSFDSDGAVFMASCNSCGGTWQLKGNVLEISAARCTLRACAPDVIELETLIAPQMNVERTGEYLTLSWTGEEQGARIMLLPASDSGEPVPGDSRRSP